MFRKKELIKFLLREGKENRTWEDLAKEFGAKNNKAANDAWRGFQKKVKRIGFDSAFKSLEGINVPKEVKVPQKSVESVTTHSNSSEPHKYEHLVLKSAWQTQTPNGIEILKSWKNNTTPEQIEKFRTDLLEEVAAFSPKVRKVVQKTDLGRVNLAEISFPDYHIGREGKDKTAEVYARAVDNTISRLEGRGIDRILYVIGNDLLNSDVPYATTKGTPQFDVDPFNDTFKTAWQIMVNSVEALKQVTPNIDIIIMPGNHDRFRAYSVGTVIEAWFRNDENVSVTNSGKTREYYKFGNTGFMIEHGELKPNDYTPIFATEQPKLWADTTFRLVRLGHLHHLIAKETVGSEITYAPSLAKNSKWEDSRGYMSRKRGFVYIHSPVEGELERLTINT